MTMKLEGTPPGSDKKEEVVTVETKPIGKETSKPPSEREMKMKAEQFRCDEIINEGERLLRNHEVDSKFDAARDVIDHSKGAEQHEAKKQENERMLTAAENELNVALNQLNARFTADNSEAAGVSIPRWEGLALAGPKSPAEAIALKREMEGKPAASGLGKVLDKLRASLLPGNIVAEMGSAEMKAKYQSRAEELQKRRTELLQKLKDVRDPLAASNNEGYQAAVKAKGEFTNIMAEALRAEPRAAGIIDKTGNVDYKKLSAIGIADVDGRKTVEALLALIPTLRQEAKRVDDNITETPFGYLNATVPAEKKHPYFVDASADVDALEKTLRECINSSVESAKQSRAYYERELAA